MLKVGLGREPGGGVGLAHASVHHEPAPLFVLPAPHDPYLRTEVQDLTFQQLHGVENDDPLLSCSVGDAPPRENLHRRMGDRLQIPQLRRV